METLCRNSIIHRNIIHYMNHGLSYIENNIYNISNNQDIVEMFPNLFISNYSTSTNFTLLKNIGITHVITINSYFNPPYTRDFVYHYFPAYDDMNEDITPLFDECTNLIFKILFNSSCNKILIHCQAGRSRSAILILAFIIKYFTNKNFQWNIKHDILNYYLFKLLRYNEINITDITINTANNTTINTTYITTKKFVLYLLNLMQQKRLVIKPNNRFIEQLINWIIHNSHSNIINIIRPINSENDI